MIIELKEEGKRKEFFYLIGQRVTNDVVKHHICIFDRDKEEVHPFSLYFRDRFLHFSLKNKSVNTIENFHLTYIIRFLNFIFNDSKTPVTQIEDLTVDMVEEFLTMYSQGKLSNLDRWISTDSVNRANYAITHFVYWLWWKKIPNTSRKMFKMNYIKKSEFQFYTKTRTIPGVDNTKIEYEALDYLVVPQFSGIEHTTTKALSMSSYGVKKLIEISQRVDPMMTFAIVLGAYAGLRQGDMAQMYEGRFKGFVDDQDFGAYLDLTYETILRSDNKITGKIKRKHNRPIFEGCTKTIHESYKNHIKYLSYSKLYPNKYGALFINNYGYAMTVKNLRRRFNAIVEIYEEVIIEEASRGNRDAIKEEQFLKYSNITLHSLRHYFKDLLEGVGCNARNIQLLMGHKSINSQDSYGDSRATDESIRRCQNEIYMPIISKVKID